MSADEIAPRLQRIEGYSKWVVDDAESIAYNVQTLTAIPGFETRAQDVLRIARASLVEALDKVERAMKSYAAKPVEHA